MSGMMRSEEQECVCVIESAQNSRAKIFFRKTGLYIPVCSSGYHPHKYAIMCRASAQGSLGGTAGVTAETRWFAGFSPSLINTRGDLNSVFSCVPPVC